MHRFVLPDGDGQSIQNSISCVAESLPRQDYMPEMSWNTPQTRSFMGENQWKKHYGFGGNANIQSEKMV